MLKNLPESERVDEPTKIIIIALVEERDAKNAKIAHFESEKAPMRIKFNQLERYQSEDCLIFCNLPLDTNGSNPQNVAEFNRSVLNFQIKASDLKAYQPLGLGKGFIDNPPPIVAKFIYSDQKERAWARKEKFASWLRKPNERKTSLNPQNTLQVRSINKRVSRRMKVALPNQKPTIEVQANGHTRLQQLDSFQDIVELKSIAVVNQRLEEQSNNAKSSLLKEQQLTSRKAMLPCYRFPENSVIHVSY